VFFQILIDSAGHSELWRTDGTAAGTGPLREVVTGGSFLNTGAIFPTGLDSERGFFWTADALWRTDGTPAGTVPVKTLRELLENPQGSSSPGPTAVWNGELYTFLSTGEVVRSDGTPAGTVRITTLGPSTRAAAVVPTPAHLFFLATDADGTPNQVWRTRGTAETTELILDTRPSFLGRSFAAAGDRLLFGVPETGLWSSDGTVSGTAPIGSDLGRPPRRGHGLPGRPRRVPQGELSDLRRALEQRRHTGGNPPGARLQRPPRRRRPHPPDRARQPARLLGLGGQRRPHPALFGRQCLRPFAVLSGSSSCANLSSSPGTGVALGSFSIFAADDGRYGRELWRSNGTADGTRLVRDINAGRVPFSADHACDLRTSLGLPSNPEGLLRYRNGALFTADDGGTGRELWWTDGTAAGTRRVIDLRPGGAGSAPHDLTVFRQLVYFIASVHGNGEALWRTDGTAKGTVRVDDLTVGGAPSWARGLTVAGNRLFFSATTKRPAPSCG
jgi:ELWxxDGT repeat protein